MYYQLGIATSLDLVHMAYFPEIAIVSKKLWYMPVSDGVLYDQNLGAEAENTYLFWLS